MIKRIHEIGHLIFYRLLMDFVPNDRHDYAVSAAAFLSLFYFFSLLAIIRIASFNPPDGIFLASIIIILLFNYFYFKNNEYYTKKIYIKYKKLRIPPIIYILFFTIYFFIFLFALHQI